MFSVIQNTVITSVRNTSSRFLVLAILLFGLSDEARAQAPANENNKDRAEATIEQAEPQTEASNRRKKTSPSPLPEALRDELEEVVVVARRIEGSGGNRRHTAAGRDDLDATDQTSMEGFFDDIDGLSTLGADGEGNIVSIDGMSADLSNVTLNGQGLGQGRGNGGFNTGDLSPDMIRRVEIYKIPSASLEEGGSGGSVNLQLRNPVEITQASSNIKARLSYVPGKGNFYPSGSFFLGQPSESRKFGYMLSLTLSDRTREYGSQSISNWLPYEFGGNPAYIPSQVRNSAVTDKQRDVFAGFSLGFRPRDNLDIRASLFLSQKHRDYESHDLQHRLERQRDITALACDGRIISELESSDRSRENLRIVGGSRQEQVDSLVLGTGFNWRPARWRTA